MMAMNIEPTILKELNIMALNYFEDTISIHYRGFCSYLAIKKKGSKTIFKKKYSYPLWCSWLLSINQNLPNISGPRQFNNWKCSGMKLVT